MTTQAMLPEVTSHAACEAGAIRFEDGIPGFPGESEWQLVQHDDAAPFLWLRAVGHQELALLVIDPQYVVPEYAPRIPRGVELRLGSSAASRPLVFAVVTPRGGMSATINLRAPIVIDPGTMRGEQVILEEQDLPLRYEIGTADDNEENDGTRRSPECSSSAERSANP